MNNSFTNKRDEFLQTKKDISTKFVSETVPITVNEQKTELSIQIVR